MTRKRSEGDRWPFSATCQERTPTSAKAEEKRDSPSNIHIWNERTWCNFETRICLSFFRLRFFFPREMLYFAHENHSRRRHLFEHRAVIWLGNTDVLIFTEWSLVFSMLRVRQRVQRCTFAKHAQCVDGYTSMHHQAVCVQRRRRLIQPQQWR